jgi:hypothetical protein
MDGTCNDAVRRLVRFAVFIRKGHYEHPSPSIARVIGGGLLITTVVLALVSCAGKSPSAHALVQKSLNGKYGVGAAQVGSCHNADYVDPSDPIAYWCWVRTDLVLVDRHHPQRRTDRKQRVAICFSMVDESHKVVPTRRARPSSPRPSGWMPPTGWDAQ